VIYWLLCAAVAIEKGIFFLAVLESGVIAVLVQLAWVVVAHILVAFN